MSQNFPTIGPSEADLFGALYDRWQDEKEHEDFARYIELATKILAQQGVTLTKMDKDFRIDCTMNGNLYVIRVTADSVSVAELVQRTPQFDVVNPLPRGVRPEDISGAIPFWLRFSDPRPAREQLNERYAHGGGWHPHGGWTLREGHVLKYPGDRPLKPYLRAQFRDETVCIYEAGIVAIFQKDGSFEVSRMD